MQTKQLSEQTCQVLKKYPQWSLIVEQALLLPPFNLDYCAAVIEIFDQLGLLSGIAWGQVYEIQRPKNQLTEFVAWYLDGQLGLFYVGSEIVVNRLSLMSASAAILLSLEEAA